MDGCWMLTSKDCGRMFLVATTEKQEQFFFFSLLPTFGLEWMFNLLGEDNDKWQVEGAKTDLNVQQVKLADKTDWVQDPMRSNYCGINI